jgi:transposase-like protein
MSRSTISTFKLFEIFPDEVSAYAYIEKRLWPNSPVCPRCKGTERIVSRKSRAGLYACLPCDREFTVKIGTIFEDSKVPLRKWLYAMYLVVTARKGISSLQLGKEIGITQKSAWFVLSRLREACKQNNVMLQGIVEVDETFVGGLERNKHKGKKLNEGRGSVGKIAVIGMRQRGGNTIAMPISRNDGDTILGEIKQHVSTGTRVMTDDHRSYSGLGELEYKHESVNHSNGEYAKGDAHTNSIESVWAVLKRGVHGTFHHVSAKHLDRYIDEFTFRLNQGKVSRHTTERLDSFVSLVAGKRITYKKLTKGSTWFDDDSLQVAEVV